MQHLLDHTAKRLVTHLEQVLIELNLERLQALTLISKLEYNRYKHNLNKKCEMNIPFRAIYFKCSVLHYSDM